MATQPPPRPQRLKYLPAFGGGRKEEGCFHEGDNSSGHGRVAVIIRMHKLAKDNCEFLIIRFLLVFADWFANPKFMQEVESRVAVPASTTPPRRMVADYRCITLF